MSRVSGCLKPHIIISNTSVTFSEGEPNNKRFTENGYNETTLDDEFHIGPKSGEKYTHLSKG